MRSLWLYMRCAGFLAIDPKPQLFWHALSINLLSVPKMELVILSCASEDYLNIEFLLYAWGSEPFRYIFSVLLVKMGLGPSASPFPSNSFSVTLLLGNLKGWGSRAGSILCLPCVWIHYGFQHRASLCHLLSLCPLLLYVVLTSCVCLSSVTTASWKAYCPVKRLLIKDCWSWSARAGSGLFACCCRRKGETCFLSVCQPSLC